MHYAAPTTGREKAAAAPAIAPLRPQPAHAGCQAPIFLPSATGEVLKQNFSTFASVAACADPFQ